MEIRGVMNPHVVSIEEDCSVALASRMLSRHNVGALPVCGEDGVLRGIVTDRDIVLRCVAPEEDPARTTVADIMTRRPATVSPGDDCALALHRMARNQVRRLPVVERGRLVGMVSLGDLVKRRDWEMEAAQALSEISENVIRRKGSFPQL